MEVAIGAASDNARVSARPNNAEQARETSGRPEKAPVRLAADRRASTNPICSEELGEFVTSETAARSSGGGWPSVADPSRSWR